MNSPSSINLILKEFLRDYPWHFGLLFLLLLVEGCAATFTIVTLVPLTDFILDPALANPSRITSSLLEQMKRFGWSGNFWLFGGLFVCSSIIKAAIDVCIRYAILRVKYAVGRGLIGSTLNSFLQARWGFFSEADQGELYNTVNRELNIIGDTLGALATLLAQTVQLFIYLAVPFWLNASVTVTALALAIVFALPFMFLHRLSYHLGQRNTDTANVATGVLNETLNAIRLILSFGRQKRASENYLSAFDRHVKVAVQSQVLTTAIPKFFQPMGLCALVISLGFALQQKIPVSELAAVMWSLLAAMPILSGLLQGKMSISNFLPSYEQLVLLRKRALTLAEVPGPQVFTTLKKGVEFENLTFSYADRSQTLSSINLFIRKGSVTALIGESGSGKSTIADLVLGLQVPSRGRVLIDDIPMEEWQQNSFRERVGYVPQDPQLFNMSIRNNLLWSHGYASEQDLWAALSLANAADFIRELPHGLDTFVGERGVRLSGGQRQRVALARALLRKPELLILDEATSSLDSQSERLIQYSIETIAGSTTILLIAHRLSTIAKADQVYVLKQGQIIEQGSFIDLSRNKASTTYSMLRAQQPSISYVKETKSNL